MKLGSVAFAAMLVAAACGGTTATRAPSGAPSGAAPTGTAAAPTGTAAAPTDAATDEPSGDPGSPPPSGGDLGSVTIPAGEPINIGFWGVASGPNASLGEDAKRGVEIAIADRGELLGREITLISEDGLCTPEGGATAAQAMAADTTIVGLIGSVCSDETVGGIQTITNAGMTTISPSNTRPALTFEDRDETYAGYLRTAHSDAIQGAVAADFVFNELGLTRVATIHDGSAYGEALVGVFVDEFTALGGEITIEEAVAVLDTNMSTVLTNVAATDPELLYFPIFTAEGGFIADQQGSQAGLEDIVLMGADGLFSQDFVTAAGPNVEGMYLSSPDFTAFEAGYAGFLEKYDAAYGGNPTQIFHAHAYDATNILLDAIEAVAEEDGDDLVIDRAALREAIYATTDHAGIAGTLSCSASGDCSDPVISVYQITAREVGGEWPPEAPIWRPGE